MKSETMLATEKMLDVVKILLDEVQPESLFVKILEVAKNVLHADAAVLDIGGESPLHLSAPEQVSISISAVKQAKAEKRAVVWNQLDDDSADLSKSIVQNQLTSIMVSPFRTPDSESGYLYLQRAARKEPFTEDDSALFDSFVTVCEKFAFAAYDRIRDKESLETFRNVVRKDGIVYSSKVMTDLVKLADKLAGLPMPVIIRGETGTGKEVIAKYIHRHSPRADKPFVPVNCGAIPEHLMESLLFGHAKGSFTGAIETRKGFFEEADGGTIFLDEIGELPMNMQVKLLRVLQEKHITRVGDNREIPVNVRVISATHVDLEEAVKAKRFREDLYFRIQVMPVVMPALRERGQDVILLAEEFLERYGAEYGRGKFRLSRNAEKAMLGYHWPGNVRELENKVQKALVQAVHGVVQPNDLGLGDVQTQAKESPRTLKEAREIVERDVIGRALRDSNANLTLAATILGIDRKVLREIMERLGMKKEDFKK
ncbi:MAG: sigma-54-dependent Fis family transcriptional regulator [Fibrobacter sp.]|jgi:transcriptional regulator with GAF, ATPase, and Fis domain|uniref:sigma-54 interaction domain-containing protein n=1 Tax=uncultured Fibrobacter sp. TaxID=261512 RepID=UPI0026222B4C|nr:sigma-54-dependent Fis family transcriptional regulator [uncultured Fibrobacter sp.]MBR2271937.1 sigma-54-dependent Fis family transcriptional regulator [Fibrobacter sp.]